MAPLSPRSVLVSGAMKMPVIGLGTFQGTTEEVIVSVDKALEIGYRHIDTAHVYGNEEGIGQALKKWLGSGKLKREDIFITTKCSMSYFRPEHIERSLDESLKKLGLDYVDLFLAHHPGAVQFKEGSGFALTPDGKLLIDKSTDLVANWKVMETLVDKKKTKSIGVSNFNKNQVKRILDAARIKPVNNQVELYLYLQQPELVKFCTDNGVTMCAYGPIGAPYVLTSPRFRKDKDYNIPLEDPLVKKLAEKYGKTAAQVLLRFLLQYGVAVIPKSTKPQRLQENFELFDFELSEGEMAELKKLDKGEEGRQFNIIPGPFESMADHPEWPHPRQK